MRKILVLTVSILAVSTAHSKLQSISANDMETFFTAAAGLLSIIDNADIVVENTLGEQTTYTQGLFDMNTFLETDSSFGGIAMGHFTGGSVQLSGSDSNDLLTGNIICLDIAEVFNGLGLLTVQGQFEVTGGALQSQFVLPDADIVQITFNVTPSSISDFSSDFTGSSNVTIIPVPEPATLCILCLCGLFIRRNN